MRFHICQAESVSQCRFLGREAFSTVNRVLEEPGAIIFRTDETVASFFPGTLVTVYQIVQLTAQMSAAAHGLKDDFACCGSQ